MKRYSFKKPLIESPTAPNRTDVYWVDIDESSGRIASIKEFKNNSWNTTIRHISTPDIPEIIGSPKDNEIWYITSDKSILNIQQKFFTPQIVSNTINERGVGIIVFDAPITVLNDHAFDSYYDQTWRTRLLKIVLPNCIESFGMACFRELTNVEVNIPTSLKGLIPWNCFFNCRSIKSMVIPEGVTHIGDSDYNNDAISHCYSLENIYIPEGVIEIGDNAFAECKSLKEIELPSTLTKLGDSVFWGMFTEDFDYSVSISFRGTMEQWNNIDKSDDWYHNSASAPVVHCTDGDVTI